MGALVVRLSRSGYFVRVSNINFDGKLGFCAGKLCSNMSFAMFLFS